MICLYLPDHQSSFDLQLLDSHYLARSMIRPCYRGRIWLSAPQLVNLVLEGQPIMVNKSSNVVMFELRETFNRAGIIFNWKPEFGIRAFGINRSILRWVELTKSKLLIRYKSEATQKEYWINHDALRNFVQNNNCEFKVSDTKFVYNIPLALFRSKPIFSGAINESEWNKTGSDYFGIFLYNSLKKHSHN